VIRKFYRVLRKPTVRPLGPRATFGASANVRLFSGTANPPHPS
jgi:hypothetical protein